MAGTESAFGSKPTPRSVPPPLSIVPPHSRRRHLPTPSDASSSSYSSGSPSSRPSSRDGPLSAATPTFISPVDGRLIRKLPLPPPSAGLSGGSLFPSPVLSSRPLPTTPDSASPIQPSGAEGQAMLINPPTRGRSSLPTQVRPIEYFLAGLPADNLDPSLENTPRPSSLSTRRPSSSTVPIPTHPAPQPSPSSSPSQQSHSSSPKRSLTRKISMTLKRRPRDSKENNEASRSRPPSPSPVPRAHKPKLKLKSKSRPSTPTTSSQVVFSRPNTLRRRGSLDSVSSSHSSHPRRPPSAPPLPSSFLDVKSGGKGIGGVDERRWSKKVFVEQADGDRVSIRGDSQDFGMVMKALRAL
ncbi:hypothetical protein DL96DRAFT_1558933 [Flagelloscypha sp. PMI_526]|nr:hypothetical protein DL96DRAFT_1558933 [Flagelloscypha sp. PMI_526]